MHADSLGPCWHQLHLGHVGYRHRQGMSYHSPLGCKGAVICIAHNPELQMPLRGNINAQAHCCTTDVCCGRYVFVAIDFEVLGYMLLARQRSNMRTNFALICLVNIAVWPGSADTQQPQLRAHYCEVRLHCHQPELHRDWICRGEHCSSLTCHPACKPSSRA